MRRRGKTATAVLALALTACALCAAALGTTVVAESAPIVTPRGAEDLRLGRTIAALRADGLIGKPRRGCELARGERIAPLKSPLAGFATFYPGKRLSAISITDGGITAAGVEVGDSLAAARKAYPDAPYDNFMKNKPIPVGLLWIGGRKNPGMTLVIEPATNAVHEIAVPRPNFCE